MVATMYLVITDKARNSLIAISVLWCLFVIVLAFRLRGRWRGPGLGLDDILSAIAFVGYCIRAVTELININD